MDAAGLNVIFGSMKKTSRVSVSFSTLKNTRASLWLSAIRFTAEITTAMFNAALAAERGE